MSLQRTVRTRTLQTCIEEFKRGYHPGSNLMKDENGDLLADSHNIWIGGRTTSLLLNVQRVSDVRQIEIYVAEPLVPDSLLFDAETAIAELKSYKSPGSDHILAELIQVGD
jgi:hypothetical protein